jgi:hypothetical protein
MDGQYVWVQCHHWKQNHPGSYRIFAGIFEVARGGLAQVCTNDDYGEGSWAIQWPSDENLNRGDEVADAWVPAHEINTFSLEGGGYETKKES